MRAVLQRVKAARVEVENKTVGEIKEGLLILLGVHGEDQETDLLYLVEKIANMRIFEDEAGKMNRSLIDIRGSALVVSQFTLYADTRRGRRPGFSDAAGPGIAEPMYERFCKELSSLNIPVATGIFGADMDVHLINQGPVTIILDTAEKTQNKQEKERS